MQDDHLLDEAFRRRDAYAAGISDTLKSREDEIPHELRKLNAAAHTKLSKVYRLIDELGGAAASFVACKAGCAACCHMNVTVSALEAKQITAATGRRASQIDVTRSHDLAEFDGVPCPFLLDSKCSIYEVRPFACRRHVSFDTNAYWCEPGRSREHQMPMVGFDGLEAAFFDVTRRREGGVFADIRDFFSAPIEKRE
jgi:Fe-S-cluster containining protein